MPSTSSTTCLLKTSATVCGRLISAPVVGYLYGPAIRLTAVPINGVVYHLHINARNRSYFTTSEALPQTKPNARATHTPAGLRGSLAGVVRHTDGRLSSLGQSCVDVRPPNIFSG